MLIVEDGTVVPGAESYIAVADADQYHADRANTAWVTLDTSSKEASLRKATDYMVSEYRESWKGNRINLNQVLDWPRVAVFLDDFGNYGAVPANIVPVPVMRACAELALRASTGELAPDLQRAAIMKKVGPIEVTYRPGAREFTKFRAVDNLLSPYMMGGGNMTRVVRA